MLPSELHWHDGATAFAERRRVVSVMDADLRGFTLVQTEFHAAQRMVKVEPWVGKQYYLSGDLALKCFLADKRPYEPR